MRKTVFFILLFMSSICYAGLINSFGEEELENIAYAPYEDRFREHITSGFKDSAQFFQDSKTYQDELRKNWAYFMTAESEDVYGPLDCLTKDDLEKAFYDKSFDIVPMRPCELYK